MAPIDIDKSLAALSEEKKTLLHQLSELGADATGELTGVMDYGDAFADAGAATAERTETMGIIENLKTHLDSVVAALARLDDGSFGTCTDCGRKIGDDRIEYMPTSSKCIDCESRSSS